MSFLNCYTNCESSGATVEAMSVGPRSQPFQGRCCFDGSRRSRSTASGLLPSCQRPKQEAHFEQDIEEKGKSDIVIILRAISSGRLLKNSMLAAAMDENEKDAVAVAIAARDADSYYV